MRTLNFLWALMMASLLAACGGGGGSAGASSGGSGGSGGSGESTSGIPTLTLAILSNGAPATSVSVSGTFVARATVKDGKGAAVAGKLVAFSVSDTAIATLTPASALTNAEGVAEVAVAATSLSAVGATTLTASATVDTQQATGTVDFGVAASSLTLSPLSLGTTSLSSGGNTSVATTAMIAGSVSSTIPVNVSYTVSCGLINRQSTDGGGVSVTTNGSGVAAATYTAVTADGQLCSGTVNVSATSPGAVAQTATLSVAAPVANALIFVSATPEQIFVAGSGAAEQSVVRFRVLSSAGTSLPGVQVLFSIATNPGGVGIGAAGATQPVTVTSNEAGEAFVSLFSGTIPGPVKLRAELVGSPTVFSESQNLTVASGPPSQRFMSLSAAQHSLEGWVVDGSSTTLTVRLADRQGNAVNDGTVVNFTSEGGQVARSCATTRVDGISQCSVSFTTQNPRTAGGRVTVLAHTSGTKDYDDNNNNNIFDAPDTLKNIGDAYRDDNENNLADISEFSVPRGFTGSCPSVGGNFPSKGNTCDPGLATSVRQEIALLFGSSSPDMSNLVATTTSVRFKLQSFENKLLPMPAGTTVSATSPTITCLVTETVGSPVVNVPPTVGRPGEDIATYVQFLLNGCVGGDRLSIKVTAPSGLVSTFPLITLQ